MAHKTSNGVVQVFDITTFLWHARCFAVLIRPFLNLVHLFNAIIRWRYPKLTFLMWLLINIFTSIIPADYSLVLFATAIGTSCALGIVHHYTQIFIKLFPDRELEMSALQTYLQRSWGDEQKILEEYRRVLLKIDSLIASFNSTLEGIYAILKWEQPLISASLAFGVLITAALLCFADVRILIFCGNNAVLLGSGLYLHRKRKEFKPFKEDTADNTNVCTIEGSVTLENEKCENDESDVDDVEAEEQDSSESTDTKTMEESDIGKSRPNVVKKLMDLRKRHHQSNAGVCTGCHSSFMSILKRKYICCNCGNQFCSRCCNLRVPKSFLGVTAPATKNDTVPLCGICHRHLLAKTSQ